MCLCFYASVGLGGGGQVLLTIVCFSDYTLTVVYCVMYVMCALAKDREIRLSK